MSILLKSICVLKLTKRCDSRRCAVALFYTLLALVMISGNVVCSVAQTQAAPKPSATPDTTQSQRPGTNESISGASITGTIKGRVVTDDDQPLTAATIWARAITGAPAAKSMRVDSEGRFAFDDLPVAVYTISATAPGYIDQSLLMDDPSHSPRYLIGAQLRITMIKGGVITGTVTNSKGEPVVGVPIRASLTNSLSAPVANPFSRGGALESDDRGIYRIYGLSPGQYIVSAGGSGPFGQFTASGFDLDVPTYYPSSTRDTALPVIVRTGEETTGIDIKYRGTEGHSISGVVSGKVAGNTAPGVITILLSHAGTTSVLSVAIASIADQRRVFSFNGIADGEYDLFAGFQPGPNDSSLVAARRVVVRGGDVTGIELSLAPLGVVAGTLSLDSVKPEDKCDKRASQLIETLITAPRDDPQKDGNLMMTSFAVSGVTLNATGEFTVRNLEAGRYRIEIKLPTEGWYVRAINLPAAPGERKAQPAATKLNPDNAWSGVITVKAGERVSGVSIMVGQDAASLRGRVSLMPEGIMIPSGLHVYLLPAEREQVNNLLRYSETLVNGDGSFALTNLAPGRYFIIARLEPLAATESTSPRSSVWDSASRIKLRGEAQALNTVVELKPCQRLVDYALRVKASP